MLDIYSLQSAIGQALFQGNVSIAGICIFAVMMVIIFAVFGRHDITVPVVIMLPAAVVFSTMSLIPTSLTIMIVLASILIIATKAKAAF